MSSSFGKQLKDLLARTFATKTVKSEACIQTEVAQVELDNTSLERETMVVAVAAAVEK